MPKTVGESKAIRIYGPYPDKKNPDKWMVNIVDPATGKDQKVVFFGTDTHRIHIHLRRTLFKRQYKRHMRNL